MGRAILEPEAARSAQPRLLDVDGAAAYLSVSPWTVRAFVANGHLTPVRLPACNRTGEPGRRILLDRQDLDAFIDARRQA